MSFKKGWQLGGVIEDFLSKVKVKSKKIPKGEIPALIHEVQSAFENSELLSNLDPYRLAASITLQAAQDADVPLDNHLIDSMMEAVVDYGEYEGIFGINTDVRIPETNAEKSNLKSKLKRNLQIYQNDEESLNVFVYFLSAVFTEIFKSLPKSCLVDQSEQIEGSQFDTHILNLIDDVYALVEGICAEFYHDDLKDSHLFEETRDILQINGMKAAGMRVDDPRNYGKDFPFPTECRDKPKDLMIESFLNHIPLKNIFFQKLPFQIPQEIRFEHTHVLAPSGYGKTHLLSKFVVDDLEQGRGFCIIDSQGDLISKLLLTDKFSPSKSPEILDKLVLVDASDVEYPPCLNLFALNDNLDDLSLKDKEILINSTVDLYTYIFTSLLGAELTARQSTVFVYISRLIMEIPNASIITLRELMEDGEKFRPYMDKLQGSARAFFKTEFFSRTFVQTKKQILYRLWAVLSNSSLERMFTAEKNKVDLYDAMNAGKIVLINTSKQVLGKVGSEIMGKFFIALLTQSAIKRASIKAEQRRDFHCYIDEAWEYVDPTFDQFINQTRKYRVAFHLFHHHLDQLPASVRSSINTSTAIKFVGAVSSKDARVMAEEMKTTKEQILDVKKYDYSHAEYSVFVKNLTETAVQVDSPFGAIENLPVMSANDYQSLIDNNRERYCRHISEVTYDGSVEPEKVADDETQGLLASKKEIAETEKFIQSLEKPEVTSQIQKESSAQSPARGGVKHKYLQALVKQLGNNAGFVVQLEHQVSSGDGYIDVVLKRDDLKIACEISVTNTIEYEVQNLKKCLKDKFDRVIMLCADPVHLKEISKKAQEGLSNSQFKKIDFLNDELLQKYFDELPEVNEDEPERQHGYKVNVNFKRATPEQQQAKQDVVDKILFNAKAD